MKYFIKSKLSENISETPEGFLLCVGVPIARTGDQEYLGSETPLDADSNDIVVVTRDEKEVFRPETIASFEGKPVTIQHPEEFVGPENWKELAVGHIQNVRRGDGQTKDDLVADILITDLDAISLVKDGLRELSCGYEAEYIQTEEGRGKQTKIVGNHLALVDEGRAGPKYAIKDSKGDHMTKLEKLLAKLGITKDSTMAKVLDEAMKEDKNKDADPAKEDKSKDAGMYDELVQICKDLGEKIDGMKPKDAKEGEKDPAAVKKDEPAKDAEEGASGMEDRMKKLEEAVAAILEKMSATGDEDKEDMEDADEGEEMEDDDMEGEMVGDTASRAEILAPGIKKTKDVKVAALKTAYATTDGKKLIESLNGGKALNYSSKEQVDRVFIAASEVLKASRGNEFSRTKVGDFKSTIFDTDKSAMTADRMNELNAKVYNLK